MDLVDGREWLADVGVLGDDFEMEGSVPVHGCDVQETHEEDDQ